MNCMNQKIKRNKAMLERKEYQEHMSKLTPEERQAREECTRETVKELRKAIEVLFAVNSISGGVYSDERIWRNKL